jgi:hypothetical protein
MKRKVAVYAESEEPVRKVGAMATMNVPSTVSDRKRSALLRLPSRSIT